MRGLSPDFVRACEDLQRRLGPDAFSDYLNLILAHLIKEFDSRFATSGLDKTFLRGFESNMSRMLDRAVEPGGWRPSFSDDGILKDFGIARMVLVPCVSHLIYRYSGVPRRSLLRQTPGSLIRATSYLERYEPAV